MGLPALTDVRGIGVDTALLLSKNGIGDVAALAAARIDDIAALPNFGPARAASVKKAAAALLAVAKDATVAESDAEQPKSKKEKKSEKGKKDKKDKKGKKKGKGKKGGKKGKK